MSYEYWGPIPILKLHRRKHTDYLCGKGRLCWTWGTGMIASSSTFCPYPGRIIRDLFCLLDAVYGIVRKH